VIGILSKQGHRIFKTLCPEFHWENATVKLPSVDQGLIGKKVGRIFRKIFYELWTGFCFLNINFMLETGYEEHQIRTQQKIAIHSHNIFCKGKGRAYL
jgi:hypothetical protein